MNSPILSLVSFLLVFILFNQQQVIVDGEIINTVKYIQYYNGPYFNPTLMTGCLMRFSVYVLLDNDTYVQTINHLASPQVNFTDVEDRGSFVIDGYNYQQSWAVYNSFYQLEFSPKQIKTTTIQLSIKDVNGTLVKDISGSLPSTPNTISTWTGVYNPQTTGQPSGLPLPVMLSLTNINVSSLVYANSQTGSISSRLGFIPISQNYNSTAFNAIAVQQIIADTTYSINTFLYDQSSPSSQNAAFSYQQLRPVVQDKTNYTTQYDIRTFNFQNYSFQVSSMSGYLQIPITLPIPSYPFGYKSGAANNYVLEWFRLQHTYNTSKTFVPESNKVSMAPFIVDFSVYNVRSYWNAYDRLSWIWEIDVFGVSPGVIYSFEIPEFNVKLYPLDNYRDTGYLFEFHMAVSLSRLETGSYTIIVCDFQSNCRTYYSGDHVVNFYNTEQNYLWDIFDKSLIGSYSSVNSITNLVFTNRKYDVSQQSQTATVYVYESSNREYFDSSCPPILELFPTNSDVHKLKKMTYLGYYDASLQLFVVNFTIPQGMLPGILDYKIYQCGTVLFSNIQKTLYPTLSNYTLEIISSGITLGPLVSDLLFTKTNNTHINVTFVIDSSYGLSWLECNITSHIDPLPYTLRLDVEGGVNKPIVPGGKSYMAWLIVDPSSKAQTFRIESIIAMDRAWNHVDSSLPNNYPHPLVKVSNKNSFAYIPSSPITTSPTPVNITNFRAVLPSSSQSPDRRCNITFTVNNNNSKLFNRHLPVVYFDDGFAIVNSDPCTLNVVGSLNNYTCTLNMPFNYGQLNRTILVSIYGFMDLDYNFYGFTTDDLFYMFGIKSIYTLSYPSSNAKPTFLSGCTPPITRDGGYCMLNGYNIDANMDLYCSTNLNEKFELYVDYTISRQAITVFIDPFKGDSLNCFGVRPLSLYTTNNFTIVPVGVKPFVPPPLPLACGNDTTIPGAVLCSGHGTCIEAVGCRCLGKYSGQYCNSTIIDGVDNISNFSNPSTDIIKGADSLASISLLGLRELALDGTTVRDITLSNWTYSNSTNNETLRITHSYSANVDGHENALVTVSIAWFQKSENISFASQILFMTPYTAKFSVMVTEFPFQNTLNTLQVLFSSVIRGNTSLGVGCSDGGGIEKPTDFDQYLSLDLNEQSLLSRFQPYGIVDQRIILIKNELLSFDINADNITAIVALNVPHFTTVTSLDPDFSLLLNSKTGNGNGCESDSSNTSMSIKTIVIIVVATAAGVSIAIASAILIKTKILKKRDAKQVSSKLNKIAAKHNA
ncbi:EGF-like domain-containing protein [Cavenderia fasciculata]|uniref:EGF-like domain-containing protein n=1 Tax=Cavenderia fasciculata TaxID=261658 RepID=F4Q323_CACFS|nr:EGF-like domain-containing protein [Cavenderia fasciculata]EGG17587.1 EGF-like domain-containing protein [Cavenderia fasciculata]|eukprot:XP_004356071.1 EGF-like domain-containing protein [Cavenderia fasciculata]